MIGTLIIIALAFTWLGYETDWMTVRLPIGASVKQVDWFGEFGRFGIYPKLFEAPLVYPCEPKCHTGYAIQRTLQRSVWHFPEVYLIYLSPNTDALVSKQWLDKHWADLEDYRPTVELSFGNGYRQTFTLKKPELIKQIMKINTGKKFFKAQSLKGGRNESN